MSLDYKVFSALCPDENCQTKLYFPVHKTVIECPNCGQCHSQGNLKNIVEVTNGEEAITQVLKSIVWDAKMPKKGSDTVKVHGLSNYHCKLLSPLFTRYGMDKEGNPRLLSDLGHGETADCGRLLSHRAFLIAPEHIEITGYGRDQSGSVQYLEGLLDIIKQYHGGDERLIPIHADGDGHCLVHALSRATTGREIFWHALRDNLVNHLEKNLKTYKNLFKDFIDQDDWRIIIDEADPYHVSAEGFNVGLGNIHIFALANVLKRPIVLLDSLKGMKNVADYTAIFVPALVEPSQCQENLPLCVAWSGSSHNHFIPLVGVAGKPLPAIPQPLIPNIWGIDKTQGMRYLNFSSDGSLTVAGGKPLQRGYLLRLVSAMEKVFLEHHSIAAKLVADMYLYVYQRVGFVGVHPDFATEKTRESVEGGKIYRCILCDALSLANVDEDSLKPGGYLYQIMTDHHGSPRTDVVYSFPTEGLQCKYDATKECLVPYQLSCWWCGVKRLRKVDRFGNTMYENGDSTETPAEIPDQCCGSKHYWDGKEYENIPKQFAINITMQGKEIEEKVTWFFGDFDPELNSKGGEIAAEIAKKYFEPENPNFVLHRNRIYAAIRSNIEDLGLTDNGNLSNFHDAPFQSETAEFHQANTKHKKLRPDNIDIQPTKIVTSAKSGDDIPSTSKIVSNNQDSKETMQQKSMLETVLQPKKDNKETPLSAVQEGTVRIRVSTSDGRQETLKVDDDLDYIGLQNTVQKHFAILPIRQVLKLGFPLKALDPKKGKMPLGLRNGDRVVVEIKPEKIVEKKMPDNRKTTPEGSLLKRGYYRTVMEDSSETLHSFVDLLQTNKDKSNDRNLFPNASVDTGLAAVEKMAQVTGKSEWEYAVSHPELFRPGGAFYGQFSRDIGLTHGRHCMLPMLPGRVFRYNGETDQVELCLEPTGHFPVSPDVVKIIESIGVTSAETAAQSSIGDTTEQTRKDEIVDPGGTPKETDVEMKDEDLDELSEPMDTDQPTTASENNTELDPQHEKMLPNAAEKQGNSMVETHLEKTAPKESKLAPGFTTLGPEPTKFSQAEAELKRQELLNVLKSKKRTDS